MLAPAALVGSQCSLGPPEPLTECGGFSKELPAAQLLAGSRAPVICALRFPKLLGVLLSPQRQVVGHGVCSWAISREPFPLRLPFFLREAAIESRYLEEHGLTTHTLVLLRPPCSGYGCLKTGLEALMLLFMPGHSKATSLLVSLCVYISAVMTVHEVSEYRLGKA